MASGIRLPKSSGPACHKLEYLDSFTNNVSGDDAASTISALLRSTNRFSLFTEGSETTLHAQDLPSLIGGNARPLFENKTWWLDCLCPTEQEMKVLARTFSLHPLTAEDIMLQEPREKIEQFRNYYFVCYNTFESDIESEDFLESLNVYLVIFEDGVLTVHFDPMSHPAMVRRRMRLLHGHVRVTPGWICYAMIDSITDAFGPVINTAEHEVEYIESCVLTSMMTDFSEVLHVISEARHIVMMLLRHLSGKGEIVKTFEKRYQDKGDIALYLGDIYDHIATMNQTLLAHEKILGRTHGNYLGQLQMQSFHTNSKTTSMISKFTLMATVFVPFHIISSLFGMNVNVPGQEVESLQWWFGIFGVCIFGASLALFLGQAYISSVVRRRTTALVGELV